MDSPARPRLDARVSAYLIEQRAKARALELAKARLEGELAASERIERAAQRYADKLEEKLTEARKREASLARALGYAEAQRDLLAARLGEGEHVVELAPLSHPDPERASTPTTRRSPARSA